MAIKGRCPPPTVKTCPHCAKPLEAAKPTSLTVRRSYIEAVKCTGAAWCAQCYAYMSPTHVCYTPDQWREFGDRETAKWREEREAREAAAREIAEATK